MKKNKNKQKVKKKKQQNVKKKKKNQKRKKKKKNQKGKKKNEKAKKKTVGLHYVITWIPVRTQIFVIHGRTLLETDHQFSQHSL